MIQVETGWVIATMVTIVGTMWGSIILLSRRIGSVYEAWIADQAEQITYLRGLVDRAAGSAELAVNSTEKAVSLGESALRRTGRR